MIVRAAWRSIAALGILCCSLAIAADQPATKPVVQLRVYEGFSALGPAWGRHHIPLALDVTTELAVCPDGNVAVDAMTIGGWRHAAGDACGPKVPLRPDEKTSADQGRTVIGRTQSTTPGTTIRCDPKTWRCGTPP